MTDRFYLWPTGNLQGELVRGSRFFRKNKYHWDGTALADRVIWPTPVYGYQLSAAQSYLSVEIKKLNGSENAYCGLLFHVTENKYYSFRVNDSAYSLWLHQNDDWKALIDWTPSSAIRVGEANRLGILAEGSQLRLFVNDENVYDISDETLQKGYAGILIGFASTGDSGAFEFDNFEIRANVEE
jgi:hypothetical protein